MAIKVFVAYIVMLGLAFAPVNAAEIPSTDISTQASSDLLATGCSPGETRSVPLSPRPELAAETAGAPRPIARHRPVLRRKTLAHGLPRLARPHAAKPRPTAHKSAAHKPTAHKPTRHLRKRVRRHIAALPAAAPAAETARPTLHKLTFASPICDDLAPAMQAFGLDTLPIGPIGDALADEIAKSLVPQNTEFASATPTGTQSTAHAFADQPTSALPDFGGFGAIPPLSGGGTGSTGGGSTTNPGGGTTGGDTGTGTGTGTGGGGGDTGNGGGTGTPVGGGSPGGSVPPPDGTPPPRAPCPSRRTGR